MSQTTRPVILRGAAVLFTLLIGMSLLGACASTPAASADAPPLQTVAKVDLSRYTGTWHEIARYPFGIQDRRCARDTTATYRLRTADTISVLNRCVQADGTESAVEGVAWILDPVSNAKLEVSFLPAWLRWLPIGRGDYWVIDLAPDYNWVVVGEPRRRYLWILARSPRLDSATYEAIVKRLPTHGYDPARLVPSPGRR
jgi:apolipoprotein D and lipocalin family protein